MKTLFALLTVAVLTGCNYSNSKKPHFTDAEIKEMSKWSEDKITGYFIGRYGKDDGVRMMYEFMQHPIMQGKIHKSWYRW